MRISARQFGGNPFFVFGPRPIREDRIRAYIMRQHRAGRAVGEIMCDARLDQLGGRSLAWSVLVSPRTISCLADDATEAIRGSIASAALSESAVRRSRPGRDPL